MLSQPRRETVTLETLDLLQKTAAYLKRLPVVPLTQELIRKIDAHLTDPSVAAARREAEAAELLASKRVAQWVSPAGQVLYKAVVEGGQVTFQVPRINILPDYPDRRMERLEEGITMNFESSRGNN